MLGTMAMGRASCGGRSNAWLQEAAGLSPARSATWLSQNSPAKVIWKPRQTLGELVTATVTQGQQPLLWWPRWLFGNQPGAEDREGAALTLPSLPALPGGFSPPEGRRRRRKGIRPSLLLCPALLQSHHNSQGKPQPPPRTRGVFSLPKLGEKRGFALLPALRCAAVKANRVTRKVQRSLCAHKLRAAACALPTLMSTFPFPEADGFGRDSLQTPQPCPAERAGFPPAARVRAGALGRRTSRLPGKSPQQILGTGRAGAARLPGKQLFNALATAGACKDQHVLCKLDWFQWRPAVPNGSS